MDGSARAATAVQPRRGWSNAGPAGAAELPLRTVLFVTAVCAAVLVYLLWWTTYTGIHFEERFVQQPAGAAGEVGGTSIRLLSLRQSSLLADQKYGGVPEQASPGTIWVVGELEAVRRPGAPEFFCGLELLGTDGGRWDKQFKSTRTLPGCSSTEIGPGSTVRFEAIFLVPERFAHRLVGIALLDPTVADRAPVITPPA